MSLDDVVVLNVDTNTLETPYSDLQSLPGDVVSPFLTVTVCLVLRRCYKKHQP